MALLDEPSVFIHTEGMVQLTYLQLRGTKITLHTETVSSLFEQPKSIFVLVNPWH
jgi:hypothetical protein